jgi:hypothetical protein
MKSMIKRSLGMKWIRKVYICILIVQLSVRTEVAAWVCGIRTTQYFETKQEQAANFVTLHVATHLIAKQSGK